MFNNLESIINRKFSEYNKSIGEIKEKMTCLSVASVPSEELDGLLPDLTEREHVMETSGFLLRNKRINKNSSVPEIIDSHKKNSSEILQGIDVHASVNEGIGVSTTHVVLADGFEGSPDLTDREQSGSRKTLTAPVPSISNRFEGI